MDIIKQIAVLALACLGGEYISMVIPITIPGSVIGLLILLALFGFKILKEDFFGKTGDFLLNNMGVFFIPAGVSIITIIGSVTDKIGIILLICIVSTIITFAVTAYTVKFVCRMQKKAGGKHD